MFFVCIGYKMSVSMVFCLILFSACFGSVKPLRQKGEKVESVIHQGEKPLIPMEPMQIVGRIRREDSEGEVFTETELFQRGLKAIKRKDWDRAILEFERLVKFFPKSLNVPPAVFNIGVIHEKNKSYEKAKQSYMRYLKMQISGKDRIEVLYRVAWVSFLQKEYKKAIEMLEKLVSEKEVSEGERIEANILRGRSLIKTGRLDSAEQVLVSSLRLFHLYENGEAVLERRLGARLAFYLARIPHEKMNETELVLPAETMSQKLAVKAKFFKDARNGYFKVLKFGCPGWSSLALREVIQLLEDFVWSIVRAPVPTFEDVRFFDGKTQKWKVISSERLREAYIDNIRNRLKFVLLGAMKSYRTNEEKTIGMGLDDFWKKDARKLLSRLRVLLDMLPSLRFGRQYHEDERILEEDGEDLFDWGITRSRAEDFRPFTIPFQ